MFNSVVFLAIVAAVANFAQRRMPPLFPPHFRANGSAPRASRRIILAHILNPAALLLFPAVFLGGSFAFVKLFCIKSLD